jgi:hypothetical protein
MGNPFNHASISPPHLLKFGQKDVPRVFIPNAAGVSVPEPPIPGDCQRREQQQGNNFFRV